MIFEHTAAGEFCEAPLSVKANGHTITCEQVVIATHNPLVGNTAMLSATLFQTKLALYTSYVMSGRVEKGRVPDALFWDTADRYHYLRLEPHRDHDVVIFGGEDHKTGQASDTNACFDRLERTLRSMIGDLDLTHRWSGQVIDTPDGLPYIGETAARQFTGTGFSGNGMTFGTLTGMMAADHLLGRKSPWSELFAPDRKTIHGGLWDYLRENKDYPYYLIRDRVAGAEGRSVRAVRRGAGRVLSLDGQHGRFTGTIPGQRPAGPPSAVTWAASWSGTKPNAPGTAPATAPASSPMARSYRAPPSHRSPNRKNEVAFAGITIPRALKHADSNSDYEVLFDLAPVPAYIFDDATCEFLAVNNAAVQFYGYSRDEFLELSLDDIRPAEDRLAFHDALQARLHEPNYDVGWRHKTKTGEILDVRIVSQPITYNGRAAHFVVATDVTEQRRLQEALFHSRRRLQALFDYSLDAIFLVNDAGEYVDVNPAACVLVGYTRDQILRMRVGDLHPHETAAQGRDMWRAFLRAGTLSGEYRLHARDGMPRDVEFRAVANVLPGLHLSVIRDVTERNHARRETETRLRESHDQLRRLSARSRARREEDRTRLARELHDQLGQALAGIKIDLHWIGQHAGVEREPGSVGAKADATMRLVDDTIWRVRRLSSQLRPPVLDKLGLVAAIEWEVKEFERRAGIRTRVQSNAEHVALDPGRATAVFRMLQEALTNVATHARATRITVAVREANGALAVSVSDNGRGIPREQIGRLDSLGLLGMRERTALLGGSIEVRGNRPRGTVVVMSIPLAERRLSPRDELS